MSVYLAIDIGTSSVKAALYEQDGRLLAIQSQEYPLHQPKTNWAQQNPADWWQAVQDVCRSLIVENRNPSIRAVCVSGQTPSCIPIDKYGKPLIPAILWLDRRATPQVEWLRKNLGESTAERIGGNTLDSFFGGLKWLWYVQERPELLAQTWKIVQANGYIAYCLSGEIAIDPSNAGLCSPCYDLGSNQWHQAVCDMMGIDIGILPDIFPSSQIVGQVTASSGEKTGIPVGTPVVCGAGDFACACLGAGVTKPGQAAVMLGTAGNLLIPGINRTDPRLLNTRHATGLPLGLGGVMAGGVVSWFVNTFGSNSEDNYRLLEDEARQTPPGADGLIFLPYLMGERTPIWDPNARGVFFGLNAMHQRAHLYRAVLEGVAFAFRQIKDIVAELGSPIKELVLINGGARSALWRQIFADCLEIPNYWLPNSGGTILGCAYLAALGCGDVKGFDTIQDWLEPSQNSYPEKANSEIYTNAYQTYKELYPHLKDCFHTQQKGNSNL
jgi:sugar (pentulose or hexulose) kinase